MPLNCCGGGSSTNEELDDMDRLAKEFKGPVQTRTCTDILFLFVLMLAYLGMTYIGLSASGQISSPWIPVGDPQRFLGGIDYQGNICGSDKPVENLSKLYKPNGNGETTTFGTNNTFPEDFSICVKNCPRLTTTGPSCDLLFDPYDSNRSWCSVSTNTVLFYCFTDGEQENQSISERLFQDLVTAAEVILSVGIFGSLFLSYTYIILLKIPYVLRAVVWATIWLVLISLAGGAAYVLAQSKIERSLLQRESSDAKTRTEVQIMEFTAYGLAVSAFIWLCVVLFMRDRIALAIGVIQNSAKAIGRMNFLLLLPLFQTIAFMFFFAIWIYYSLCVVSSGEIKSHSVPGTDDESYKTFEIAEDARKLMIFMIMIWLWTSEVITAFGQLVIAYSVSSWYFKREEEKKVITSFVVMDGIYKALRYHIGTIATGGFILAVVRPIRSSYAYVYSKLKGKGCGICKYFLCCLNCFFTCFEKLLQYLNQSAYIQTAIFGTCFCVSAKKGLALMVRNASRVGVVGVMSDLVITVGKVLITLLCGGFAYWYFTFYMANQLGGYFFPTFTTAVLAYVTANIVCQVMSMSAETILVCYITDEEVFAGIGGFSPPELKKYLSENGGFASDEYDEESELARKN